MAKVRLLCSRQGPNVNQNAGDEVEVPDEVAARMVAAGQAVLVERAKKTEKAVPRKAKVEKAAK